MCITLNANSNAIFDSVFSEFCSSEQRNEWTKGELKRTILHTDGSWELEFFLPKENGITVDEEGEWQGGTYVLFSKTYPIDEIRASYQDCAVPAEKKLTF